MRGHRTRVKEIESQRERGAVHPLRPFSYPRYPQRNPPSVPNNTIFSISSYYGNPILDTIVAWRVLLRQRAWDDDGFRAVDDGGRLWMSSERRRLVEADRYPHAADRPWRSRGCSGPGRKTRSSASWGRRPGLPRNGG